MNTGSAGRPFSSVRRAAFALSIGIALGACSGPADSTHTPPGGNKAGICDDGGDPASWPLPKLSSYGFFTGAIGDQSPASCVVPYEVVATLWSDYALKDRFIVMPKGGGTATLAPDDDWDFPTNTIVIKTFEIPIDRRSPDLGGKPVETRLLIKQKGGWAVHKYVFDDDGKDATLTLPLVAKEVPTVDVDGKKIQQEYIIPDVSLCPTCHERDDGMHLLGVTTRQMNRDVDRGSGSENQLAYLKKRGVLASVPAGLPAFVDPFGTGPMDDRARVYLAANCSHCHRPDGYAQNSSLFLLASEPWATSKTMLGICKAPPADPDQDGRLFDIVPGDADASIMPDRMDPPPALIRQIKMPQQPSLLPDPDGTALIRAWITDLPTLVPGMAAGCPQP